MNCRDYREAIAAEPSECFEGGAAHAAGCAACAEFREEMRALDACIARALAIDVPEVKMPELPPVETGREATAGAQAPAASPSAGRRPFMSLPLWAGLAAAVAVAAFLGLRTPGGDDGHAQLVAEIVGHMDHEQASRQVTSVAVAEDALARVVDPAVATMDRGVGLITYAMSCVINGRTVPHLVVQGDRGPITLILMSEEPVERPVPLSGENVHGVLVPAGSGSIAIIGQREGQLAEVNRIGDRLARSVEWTI